MAYPLLLDPYTSPATSPEQPFDRRALHPWMNRRPMPLSDPETRYPELLQDTSGPRLAYLHIPFCANHCLFCGFYRNRTDDAAMSVYVDHLIREIERDAIRPGFSDRPVAAIFLGGGTPSALSAIDLHRLIATLRRCLPVADDCEITVEGRVAGFDAEKIDACLDAGANRFSIGIQSFDTHLRRRMGRRASQEEAIAFLADLAARKRAAVICDLIYGLPAQTDDIWRRDVALCDEIGLDGVDLYCLSLQPGSPLVLSIEKGALPPAAETRDTERRYYEGGNILEDRGWSRLSQAHWGRTPRERNRYNRGTKRGLDCLAFGAGAGGMLGGHRFMLEGDVATYQARIAAGEKPITAMLAPAPHHAARGLVMDAAEMGSLDFASLDAAVDTEFSAALLPLFRHWQAVGVAALNGSRMTLTPRGRYWHNNVADVLFKLIDAYLDGPAVAHAPMSGDRMPVMAHSHSPDPTSEHPHAEHHSHRSGTPR